MSGAERVHDTGHLETGGVSIDDELGNSLPSLAGPREDDSEIGIVGSADPQLGTVDDPVVAVAYRLRPDSARRIAAAARLTQAEEPVLLAAQAWIQVPLFLVVVGLVHLSQPRSPEYPVARGIQASSVLGRLDAEPSACHHAEARNHKFCRRTNSSPN